MAGFDDMAGKRPSRGRIFARGLRHVLAGRFLGRGPFLISHLITARCFARCPTCLWRGECPEAAAGRVLAFYNSAREAGFVSTNFWGGEPLLREDLPEILKGCHRLGFVTGVVTNGYLLAERCNEIVPWLDHLVISLDLPSAAHDDLRGVPGLFGRALAGIEQARRLNGRMKLLLNAVVSRYSHPGVLGLVDLAGSLGTTVTFEVPDEGLPRFRPGEGEIRSRLPEAEERAAFRELLRRKAAGAPINNSRTYLRAVAEGRLRYPCHLPQACLRIGPDGRVGNCLHPDRPLGNVFTSGLREILDGAAARELVRETAHCSRCTDTAAFETSLFWSLHPEVAANTLKLFLTS